jgi:16S rRNA (cytosine1402-N4)-methyltransferase
MRMNKRKSINAKQVLNEYPKQDLIRIFKEYGEIRNADKLSSVIVAYREQYEITGTDQFRLIIKSCAPRGGEFKYLATVFQALRIEINRELEALKEVLLQTLEVLKPAGRLVVISYHSLEDRIVKNFMRTGNLEGNVEKDFYGHQITYFKLINKRPIVPDENEISENPRSRSAKLRIAEKV